MRSVTQPYSFFIHETTLLNYQFIVNELLKFFTFNQLFYTHEQNKRTVWSAQHTVDLIDTYVAVLCCFFYCQSHFLMNRYSLHCLLQAGSNVCHRQNAGSFSETICKSHILSVFPPSPYGYLSMISQYIYLWLVFRSSASRKSGGCLPAFPVISAGFPDFGATTFG